MENEPIEIPEGKISVTISGGAASAPMASEGTTEFDALLRAADESLYLAKDKGRNRMEIAPGVKSAAASA